MLRSVVIASILKPVTDTRMMEKMARSLSLSTKYKVFIIGYAASRESEISNVTLVPLFSFARLSVLRLFAPWKFLLKLWQLKPSLIIVNTYELLGAAIIYKVLSGCKLIYDVRENYFLNVLLGRSFFKPIRKLAAYYIRFYERISASFVNYFLLAEQSYEHELPFVRRKYSVLHNRVSKATLEQIKIERIPGAFQFLICGTISEEYGILEGIDFFNDIRQEETSAKLDIIGHCANRSTLKKILKKINGDHAISFSVEGNPVDHLTILQAIANSNYLLMPYQNSPQITSSFPTKIYEAYALSCPVVISSYGVWKDFVEQNNTGILVDFMTDSPSKVLTQLRLIDFSPHSAPSEIYWESLENKFLKAIEA